MNPEEPKTADQTAAKAIKALTPAETNEIKPLSKYVSDYYETLKDGAQIEGLYSGFPTLDDNLRGLRQTIVLAGSPKTGKTSFCTQLITQIADFRGRKIYPQIPLKSKRNNEYPNIEINQKQAVLFYSLEMSKSDITTKLISQLSGVDYWKIRLNRSLIEKATNSHGAGAAPEDIISADIPRLAEAEKKRAEMVNVYIRDLNDYPDKEEKSTLNFETVKREIDQVKRANEGAELIVFIDHLQVFPIEQKEYKDQIEKEGKLIKEFNRIALEKGVTMFLISQTNKEAMKETADLFKDLKEAEGPAANYDSFLSGVKGSVDTVYIATGIWSMVKTGREAYLDKKIEGNATIRPLINVKLISLIVTERNSRGGVFYLLYFPFEQRFIMLTFDEIEKYCKVTLKMTAEEYNAFMKAKKRRESSATGKSPNSNNETVNKGAK